MQIVEEITIDQCEKILRANIKVLSNEGYDAYAEEAECQLNRLMEFIEDRQFIRDNPHEFHFEEQPPQMLP